MSNDLIYLQCTTCEKMECMVKYYPSNNGVFYPDSLIKFIDTHIKCNVMVKNRQLDLKGEACFKLLTESNDDDFKIIEAETLKGILNDTN